MPTVYWHYLHVWDDSNQIWLALSYDGQGHSADTWAAKWQAAEVLFSTARHIQQKPKEVWNKWDEWNMYLKVQTDGF